LKESGVPFREGVAGSSLTTYAIGAALRFLVEPETEAQLSRFLLALRGEDIPLRYLGAGSNLLLPDTPLDVVVIRLGRGFGAVQALEGEGNFRVGASASLMRISRTFSEDGYAGLEFAGGIPASLGGAARMNAGAHGGEMVNVIHALHVMHPLGELQRIDARSLTWAYRESSLSEDMLITALELRLVRGEREQIRLRRAKLLAERKARQPLSMPSAGSVFRNPEPQRPAGALLEQVGMKGERRGGAEVSQLHANWIVNPKREATQADVEALMCECERRVLDTHGIRLRREVVTWR